jgi:protein arginine kinase
MSSKEALNLLSIIKLGLDLGLFPESYLAGIDALFIETQPAHLQKSAATQKLSAEQRDTLRAARIRLKLQDLPQPDTARIPVGTQNESTHDE